MANDLLPQYTNYTPEYLNQTTQAEQPYDLANNFWRIHDDTYDARFLAALRKYDPNARFETMQYGGERQGEQTNKGKYVVDGSLMPKSAVAKSWDELVNFNAQATKASDPNQIRKDVLNPSKVYKDPVYGTITPNSNIRDQKLGLIDILGPMAVMGVAGLGGGLAGLSPGAKTAMAIPSLARSLNEGGLNAKNLLRSAIPLASGMVGGQLGSLARTGLQGLNTYNAFRSGNTPQGLQGLYNVGRQFFPTGGG